MTTNDTAKTLPKMRTFATDLSANRVDGSDHTAQKTPVKTAPPVAAASSGVIPPFHTFTHAHKDAAPVIAAPVSESTVKAQQIISANSTKSKTTTESLPAVIITDTKRKRFSLTEALGESMSQWWHTKKEEARKRKLPKYTVASAERRKGVIQKATTKTGRESTADHAAVVSRIKAAKQVPHNTPSPLVSTTATHATTPTWESGHEATSVPKKPAVGLVTQKIQTTPEPAVSTIHTNATESPSHIHNASIPIISAVAHKPVTTAAETVKKIEAVPAVAAKAITVTEPEPVKTTPATKTQSALPITTVHEQPAITPITPSRPKITPVVPASTPNFVPAPTPSTIITNNVTPSNPPSVFDSEYTDPATPRAEKGTPERQFAPPRTPRRSFIDVMTQTNQLVFISFGVLLFVVVTGLSLRSYLQNSNTAEIAPVELTEVTTTFDSSSIAPSPTVIASSDALFTELRNQLVTTNDLFEITFINSATNAVVSPDDFFSFTNAPVVFDFKETVTEVRFGGYQSEPWVTLSVLDAITALGGMLQWETTMASNLSPIFNPNTIGTANTFTDGISGTRDVRILKNNEGDEVLVYGFISETTIIITSDTDSFMFLVANFPTP
ncbi:MAG: hypothetical protein V4606_02135 [Patescibacteria group bacterium]